MEDFSKENLAFWQAFKENLVGQPFLGELKITEKPQIIKILNDIGKGGRRGLNHTFHPESGGLDLLGVKESQEKGCIDLFLMNELSPTVVKPVKLYYCTFEKYPELDFLYLETGKLPPSGLYENVQNRSSYEMVALLPDGSYKDHDLYVFNNDTDEELVPEGTVEAERIFEGAFVIFPKTSPYNELNNDTFDAYNAHHNKMSYRDFRAFVISLGEYVHSNKNA